MHHRSPPPPVANLSADVHCTFISAALAPAEVSYHAHQRLSRAHSHEGGRMMFDECGALKKKKKHHVCSLKCSQAGKQGWREQWRSPQMQTVNCWICMTYNQHVFTPLQGDFIRLERCRVRCWGDWGVILQNSLNMLPFAQFSAEVFTFFSLLSR